MICNKCRKAAFAEGRSTAATWSCTVCHRRSCDHAVADKGGRCSWCVSQLGLEVKKPKDAA